MNAETVGKQIAALRRSRGLTQKELAEKLHVTDKAVSKWERGLNFPELTLLEPLAEELGTTVGDLLSLEKATQQEIADTVSAMEKKTVSPWRSVSFVISVSLSLLLAVYILCTAGLETEYYGYYGPRNILLLHFRRHGAIPLIYGTLTAAALLFCRANGLGPKLKPALRGLCLVLFLLMAAVGGYYVYGICSFVYFSPIKLSLYIGNHPNLAALWWMGTAAMLVGTLPPKKSGREKQPFRRASL